MINVNLLPKHLRRVKEPAYWRLIAVLFPLLVFGVIAGLQFSVSQTEKNKQNTVEQLQVRRDQLQPFVQKQRELQTELQNLQVFENLSSQIKDGQIFWTAQVNSLLETLPARGNEERPRISFDNLSLQAVSPPTASEERFDGATIDAEMSISGQVVSTEVLSDFISALENSNNFGVDFQSASLEEASGYYTYNLTIGALANAAGGDNEPQQP